MSLAERFLLVPVMLIFWGAETLGVWMIICSIPAYLSLTEMGFANAAGNMLTRFVVEENYASARKVYWSTSVLINAVSMICLGLTALVVLTVPLAEVFNCNVVSSQVFGGALFLMAVYTVAMFRSQLLYALARSVERHAIVAFQTQMARVAEILCCILVVAVGGGLMEVAIGYLITRLGQIFAVEWALHRHINWLEPRSKCDKQILNELVGPALGFAGLSVAQGFQLQGVTLILAMALSPTKVAAYTAMRTLARLSLMIGLTFCKTVWPEMSSATARSDISLLTRIHRKTCYITTATNCLSLVLLLTLGPTIFAIWTSGKLPFDSATFVLLCFGAAATSSTTAAMAILNAGNKHGRAAVFWTCASLVSLILCFVIRDSLTMVRISAIMAVFDLIILIFIVLASVAYLRQVQRKLVTDSSEVSK